MKRIFFLLVISVCTAALLAFTVDYLMFQYRVARKIDPFESVTVQVYYSIQEKNSRTEYVYKSTEQQVCAHSLFSRSGFPPCWYARRHTERAVPI